MSAAYHIGPKRSGVGTEITITMEPSVFGKDFDSLNDAADEAADLGLISDAEFQRIFLEKTASNGVSLATPNLEGRGFKILRHR